MDLKDLDKRYNENPIPMNEWVQHFTSLLNTSLKTNRFLDENITQYIHDNRDKIFNELNFMIGKQEILNSAKHLKSNKAAGIDGIVNEILKAGMSSLIEPMGNLFHGILTNGQYPAN